jgi:hypothetical protein
MKDSPIYVRQRRRRRGIAITLAAIMALESGCGQHSFPSFDRLNHLHNDTNQKLAEDSLDGFGKFTSQQGGLAATLEKNLQARRELETTVANARAALDDLQRAFTTTDVTWTQLRIQVFRNLGLPDDTYQSNDTTRGDLELSRRIGVRQALVGAIGKNLELLGRVQQALLEQARADAARAKKDLDDAQNDLAKKAGPVGDVPTAEPTAAADDATNGDAATTGGTSKTDKQKADERKARDVLRCKRVKWALSVIDAFRDAGEKLRDNQVLRGTANTLQLRLLDEIRASRDPAEAYAVVALVGTGLSENDFLVLTKYLDELEQHLAKVETPETEGLTPNLLTRDLDELEREMTMAENGVTAADPQERRNLAAIGRADAVTTWRKQRLANRPGSPPPAADDAAWYRLNLSLLEAKRDSILARNLHWERVNSRTDSLAAPKRMLLRRLEISPPARGPAAAQELDAPVKRYENAVRILTNLYPTAALSEAADSQPAETNRAAAAPPDAGAPEADRTPDRAASRATTRPQPPLDGGGMQKLITAQRQSSPFVRLTARRTTSAPKIDQTERNQTPANKAVSQSVGTTQDLIVEAATGLHDTRMILQQQAKNLRATAHSTPKPVATVALAAKKRAAGDTASKAGGDAVPDDCHVAAPDNLDPQKLQGFEILKLILSTDPALVVSLGHLVNADKIPTEQLALVGQVANDVTKEVLAAKVRIRQFIDELSQAHVDVAAENVRHYEAILAIAELETKRWALLGQIDEDYLSLTDPIKHPPRVDPNINVPLDDPKRPTNVPLFQNLAALDRSVYTVYKDLLQARKASEANFPGDPAKVGAPGGVAGDHPSVVREDFAFASIRRLADAARARHSDPARLERDPLGFHLDVATVRLHNAIRIVEGQLLLVSLNEHSADENAIRLHTEIAEHTLQLDSLDSRVREAGFKLGLGDLKAFHASGITEQDIRTIETGILTWIGTNVK